MSARAKQAEKKYDRDSRIEKQRHRDDARVVPRDLVWKAFTELERMQQWWVSKGVKVVASKMDLRPGGTYHYAMQTPDGKVMWGKFAYRELVLP